MIVVRLLPAFLLSSALLAYAQEAAPPDGANHPDKGVGTYYVVNTTIESSPATHLLNPELTIQVDAASKLEPKDVVGTLTVPGQYALESVGKPRYICIPALARDHGCDDIDRCTLSVRDPNTLEYHIVNHGAAVQLKVNLEVHDIAPVSRPGDKQIWHPDDVIFVSVPASTPTLHFVSSVLVGEWNHQAVVFEVGKPLPPAAKKALEDLGVHQNLGDKFLYSYRVKEPEKPKVNARAAAGK